MSFDLTPIQLAHFLGQCSHETGGFKLFEENLNYWAEGLVRVWPKRYDIELAVKHERKPSVIANYVYSGRMGNKQPNDGWHFRGRGAIQLTGRSNYNLFSEWIKDPTVMNEPDLVSGKYAFDSALWFYKTNKLDKLAEDLSEKTITLISKGVNLGNPFSTKNANGLQDRIKQTLNYKQFIT
jgi:putative chitinase